MYHGPEPAYKIFDFFNFPPKVRDTLYHFPLDELTTLQVPPTTSTQQAMLTDATTTTTTANSSDINKTTTDTEQIKQWILNGSDR